MLTNYIIALMREPAIHKADPVKAAARYGISEAWAREYLKREIARRN
jgi:hypothetical protein